MVALSGLEKFSHLEDKIYRTIELTKSLRQEKESLEKELSLMRRNRGGGVAFEQQRLEKQVEALLAERDIIRALSSKGPASLTRPVSDSMTREVVSCQETDTLDELMALMTERRFRHLPVMADNALVGIISIGDVVKHHVAEVTMEATAIREYITHS